MSKKVELVHINDNEDLILNKLGTWLIDYANYYSHDRQIFITREKYEELKILVNRVNLLIGTIDTQIEIGERECLPKASSELEK